MKVANSFTEFVEVIEKAERKTLNSEVGQKLTKELLKMKLESDPNMTEEEWKKTKSEFMTFLFLDLMKNNEELRNELAGHVYNELRGEEE